MEVIGVVTGTAPSSVVKQLLLMIVVTAGFLSVNCYSLIPYL